MATMAIMPDFDYATCRRLSAEPRTRRKSFGIKEAMLPLYEWPSHCWKGKIRGDSESGGSLPRSIWAQLVREIW